MKHLFLLLIFMIALASCTQQELSDKQRQRLREEKDARKIQRLTNADILNAAKAKAEKIYDIEAGKYNSIIKNDKINWVNLKDTLVDPYQQKIQEAYQYSLDQGLKLYDNIEDTKDGKIIFTKPAILQDSIPGFWVIVLEKKEVIKGL